MRELLLLPVSARDLHKILHAAYSLATLTRAWARPQILPADAQSQAVCATGDARHVGL